MRVLDLIKVLSAVFIITVCALAQTTEEFKFEVTTTATSRTFAIPLSGLLNNNSGKTYNWNINWGDGSTETKTDANGGVANGNNSAGIPHEYAAAGTRTITITPAVGSSTDAWLGAFGFHTGTAGANAQANKDMVTKVISPLTPKMTRTQAQLTAGTAPIFEWANTFYGCTNLTMDDGFNFSPEWDGITTVGMRFATSMFQRCNGTAFNMSPVFNLPPNITTVAGTYFAAYMFSNCSGAAFMVNDVFKFPLLTQSEVNNAQVFSEMFYNSGTGKTQTRTIQSIVNGNPLPNSNKNTFTNSGFPDRSYAPTNWGGDNSNPNLTITINTQPTSANVTYNSITGSLSVAASAAPLNVTPSYQWYSNTSNSNTGGTLIAGATGASFPVPTNLTAGTHYYYCIVSIWQWVSQTTNAAAVTVAKADYNMSGITFANKTATYDGTSQSILISGTLPSGVTVSYTGNGQTAAGAHQITANFATTNNNYNAPASRTATLTINKATGTFGTPSALSATYTPTLTLAGITPPANYAWVTTTTSLSAGNNQSFPATYNDPSGNYNSATGNITVNVAKADYNMSGITFANKTATYDGTSQSILISGTLPSGVSVTYTGNNHTTAGSYTVTANFATSNSNYNVPSSRTATLTINKATPTAANLSYNLSAKTYNASAQGLSVVAGQGVSGLGNITVKYDGDATAPANAGTYAVTADIAAGGNYNAAVISLGNYTINKATTAGVAKTEHVVAGYAHSYHFDLATLLPNIAGLTNVTYNPVITSNASGVLGALDYTSGNTLTIPVNNVIGAELLAEITVTISSHNYENFTAVITVTTVDKKLVEITGITIAGGVYNGNQHGYAGTPIFTRPDNNETVTDVTFEILYESTDGKNYSSATAPTDAGEYRLTVKVPASDPAYIGEEDFEFTIAKADYDMGGITFAGKTVTYNGQVQSIIIGGALPVGVTVSYANNDKTNAGTYTVTANFATTNNNYNIPASKTATLTIAKAEPAATAYTIPTGLTALVGQTLASVTLSGGLSWMDGTLSVGAVGSQTHKAKFTPSDIANYNVVENIDVTVTVSAPVSISKTEKSGNGFGVIFKNSVISDKLEIVKVVLPDGKVGKTVSVIIYDNTGNVVYSGTDTKWDLRNKSGRIAANGGYLVIVEAKDNNGKVYYYSAKVVVKR